MAIFGSSNLFKEDRELDDRFRCIIRRSWMIPHGTKGFRWTYAPRGYLLVSRVCEGLEAGQRTTEVFREITTEDLDKAGGLLRLEPRPPDNPFYRRRANPGDL